MGDFVFTVLCIKIPRRKAYSLFFKYNEQLVGRIKSFPTKSRKWNVANNCWELTTPTLYDLIKSYKKSTKIYFDFGNDESKKEFIIQMKIIDKKIKETQEAINDLEEKKKHWIKYKEIVEKGYKKYWDIVHDGLKNEVKMYPHQVAATMYLNEVRNALLAFDMGTGKSLISIAFVELNKFEKVFVITPNSLKFNYYYEVDKFTNSKAHVVNWKNNKHTISESKYIIVNYEFFATNDRKRIDKKWKDLGIDEIDCLISDESHRLKSSKSATYKHFKRIFKNNIFKNKKPSKIFMSGTPAPSRAYELYNVLNQISPLEFATKTRFYEYYCGMTYNPDGFGYDTNLDNTRFEELFNKISPIVYRKKKSDVLKDLPEKTYQKVFLEMTPKEEAIYNDIEEGVANEFLNENISNPMAMSIMGRLREYTSFLKVKNTIELIDSVIESGEKIVIVDFYKKSLIQLHEKYKEISELHTGDVKDYIRAEIIKRFQDENDRLKIFLGSEQTTKEGLTLTEASKIGVLTIPFVPGVLDQITDRLVRIGQKYAVNAYLFMYRNSIDEYVFNLIESKRSEISQVIDNEKYISNVSSQIINNLIEIIKKKHGK